MKINYAMLTLFTFLLLSIGTIWTKRTEVLQSTPSSKVESLEDQIEKFGEECDVEAYEADPDCQIAAELVEERSKLQSGQTGQTMQPEEIEEYETVEYE